MIERLALPDVLLGTSTVHRDARGAFAETYRASTLAEAGVAATSFVQENLVRTAKAGVLRGLHFQLPPFAQAKLVQVVAGALFDVAVDVRPDSPTLGRWVGVTLSAETPRQMFVPAGFAHGYLTLTDDCVVLYKTSAYYAPDAERGICWNDPALAIDWPMESVSANARDESWPPFAEAIIELERRG